jgi:hypothetical protein
MDNEVIAYIVAVAIAVICIIGVGAYSVENTRACKMEAAAKGYNVKEICE